MSTHLFVTCINKPTPFDPHSRIQGIGGPGWYMTEDQAIHALRNGTHVFTVTAPGAPPSAVIVALGPTGHPCLKTSADGILGNNLLSLQQCYL
jgi:hypothetical protein